MNNYLKCFIGRSQFPNLTQVDKSANVCVIVSTDVFTLKIVVDLIMSDSLAPPEMKQWNYLLIHGKVNIAKE